jgi:hypothetical protein
MYAPVQDSQLASGGLLEWDMWASIDRNRLPRPHKYASIRPQFRLSRVASGPSPLHQQTTATAIVIRIDPVNGWRNTENDLVYPAVNAQRTAAIRICADLGHRSTPLHSCREAHLEPRKVTWTLSGKKVLWLLNVHHKKSHLRFKPINATVEQFSLQLMVRT